MRTAEEILLAKDHDPEMLDYGETIDAINEARKEVIEELANETEVEDNNWHPVITKEAILKKLDDIK